MDLGQQIAMTAMLLLSSKGMAGVLRGSLVVAAAVNARGVDGYGQAKKRARA